MHDEKVEEASRDVARRLGICLAGIMVTAMLAWAVTSCFLAPLDGVEAGNWYGASRIRRGLSWFVDPRSGAYDDGPLPILSMQMYTPLYGWVLARVPAASTTLCGRLLGITTWFGGFAILALAAPARNRPRALIYGLCTASLVFVSRVAATLTADVLAAAFACLALVLVLERRRVTLLAGALLLVGAFLKPNVIGVLIGVGVADATLGLRSRWTWLAMAAAGGALVLALQLTSDGAWFFALRVTTQNAFSVHRWTNFVVEYGWFLGAPQVAIAIFVGRGCWRDAEVRYGVLAIVTSVVWQFVATGRHGSATNYWVEPLMATAVFLAAGPPARLDHPVLAPLVTVGYPILVAAVSVVPAWRQSRAWRSIDPLVREIEALCPRDRSTSWTSTSAELELRATGKISVFEFGLKYMIRRGELGLDELIRLLRSPGHVCFIHDKDLRVPIVLRDRADDTSLFDEELRGTILENYEMIPLHPGVFVYRRSARPVAPEK